MAGSNQKNLDIVIRGRDETKKAFSSARKNTSQFGSEMASTMNSLIAVAAIANTAAQAGAAAVEMMGASGRRASAAAKKDLTGMLDAEIEGLNATTRLLAGIPIFGPQIQRAMAVAFDIKSLQEWVAQIKAADASIQKLAESEARLATSIEIRLAKLAGAPESELTRIKAREERAAIEKQIDEAARNAQTKSAQWQRMNTRFAEKVNAGATNETLEKEWAAVEEAKRQMQKAATQQNRLQADKDMLELIQQTELADQIQKETAAARQKAEKERASATQSVGGYLASDEERNIERVKAEGAKMKALAQKYGGDVAGVEAETARRVAEVRQAARDKETQEEKRAAEEKAQEREKEEQAHAAAKQKFTDIIFNATHSAKERELRELKASYKESAALYANDAEMRKTMQAAYAIQEAEINKRHAGESTPRNVTTQALSSRFQTRAQGRDDPKWVQEASKRGNKQIELLKLIAEKSGVTVDEVRFN